MKVALTVDMDNYREYQRLVDPDGAAPTFSFYDDAVPRFLDVFDRHGVRATFFMVGCDATVSSHRSAIREIAARGHEVANHSWSHPYNLRSLPLERKVEEIARAEDAISDILGERPVGFRCPSGELDREVLQILDERGYHYDSSVFPTPFMWLFMIYGKLFIRHADYSLGQISVAFAPRRPYWPTAAKIHRGQRTRGAPVPSVLEIPFSTVPILGLPLYGTLFRMLGVGPFERAVQACARRGASLNMIYHLLDLVDHEGSSLGEAIGRTPGLGVPFERRQDFVDRSAATLAAHGEAVPLRELAAEVRSARVPEASAA